MRWQGAARPASLEEKTRRRAWRAIRDGVQRVRGRLPLADAQLARALDAALARGTGGWFAISNAFAESALGSRNVVVINPAMVRRWLISQAMANGQALNPRDFYLGSGDWSGLIAPLSASKLDREARELFAAQGEYRETDSWHALVSRPKPFFHNGNWIRSDEDADAYFSRHAALLASIAALGVVARNVLNVDSGRRRSLEKKETDSGIAIGPDGELLRYRGGFHRLAFAQELGLPRMPAAVRLVHVEWLRAEMDNSGLASLPALLAGLARIANK